MNTLLKHLACVMDGNRRWAHRRGMPAFMGHKEGVHAVNRVVKFCLEKKIPHVSFYAFSLENLQRSSEEKEFLYRLMVQEMERVAQEAQQQHIRIRFVGDRAFFHPLVAQVAEHIEQSTMHGDRLHIDLLFCYSGQQEIVHVVQTLAHTLKNTTVSPDVITKEMVEQHLWTYPSPPPDLIIRTGGFQRLSGFHLYHAAYAELRFLDCLWPDITERELEEVVNEFYQCQRRFGR